MEKIMNKITKIIIAGLMCYLFYLAYFAYETVRYGHSHDWNTCKQYIWFFKESVKQDIDPPGSLCISWIKKRDVNNVLHYCHNNETYPVTIWEFKDLANIDLDKITIKRNVNLSDIKFISGEVLHSESSFPVTINYGFAFHNALNINLDSYSKIDGTFAGPNYKGFYGKIHKMSFSDEKGKHQIIFDYTDKPHKTSFSPTVFLVYKGHQSFYVIIINSEKPFKDASIINILNLQ